MNNNRKTVLAFTVVIYLSNRELFPPVGENVHFKSLAATPWLNIRSWYTAKSCLLCRQDTQGARNNLFTSKIYFITCCAQLHQHSVCVILSVSMDYPNPPTAPNPYHHSNMISPVCYLNDLLQLIVSVLDTSVLRPRPYYARFVGVFAKLIILGYRLQRRGFRNHIWPQLNTFEFGCVWID